MNRVFRILSVLLALLLLCAALGPANLALTRDQRRAIMKSAVLILPLKFDKAGKVADIPWRGSGTIIDAKGLILTNYHVVEETGEWDALGILVTTRSDQRPEPTYRAKIVAKDPKIDLAVIRIVADAKGNAVDPATLNLPAVKLGNADDLEIGDELTILGYPGIGSSTITLTEGKVSGFLQEDGVSYQRAWIKTDATIAGGNSGGTAVDADGNLVGVPTRVSATDSRKIADTNGDGVVDEKDSAVSTGGFINQLRPINLAYPLINKAQKALVSPPSDEPAEPDTPRSMGTLPKGAKFGPVVFASEADADNNPVNPASNFPADILEIFAFNDYQGMVDGVGYMPSWSVDGELVWERAQSWDYGAKGTIYNRLTYGGDPLPAGEYTFKLTVGDTLVQSGAATVGGKVDPRKQPQQKSKGVTFSGYVLDADTGEGIEGAYIIILKPGVTVRQFLKQQKAEQMAAASKTDAEGYYRTAPPLARGESYGAVALAKGYKVIAEDDALTIEESDPDEVELDPIEMTQE